MAKELKNLKSENWIEIKDSEFNDLRDLVYKRLGINLSGEKRALVMGRLQKTLKQKNLKTFGQYYNFVVADKSGSALSDLANLISTNHTYFFRENSHFDYFYSTVLPQIDESLKASTIKDIRIWSAGCSSGEEPYMLVMLMMDYFGTRYKSLNAGILATDISEKALNTANNGVYSDDKINLLPDKYKKKYFKKVGESEWKVNDIVKKEVIFRRFNLMNEVFNFKKQFHVIFCRNVMIYFDEITKNTLVHKFEDLLLMNGYLFIGHSENIKKKLFNLNYILPALYRKTK